MREKFKLNKDRDDIGEDIHYNKFKSDNYEDLIGEDIVIFDKVNTPLSKNQINILSNISNKKDPDYIRAFYRKSKMSKSKSKRKPLKKCKCK